MTDKELTNKKVNQLVISTVALLFVAGLVCGGTAIILNIIEFFTR